MGAKSHCLMGVEILKVSYQNFHMALFIQSSNQVLLRSNSLKKLIFHAYDEEGKILPLKVFAQCSNGVNIG